MSSQQTIEDLDFELFAPMLWVFRMAAILALVLLVMEQFVPLDQSFGTPRRRLAYVLVMSISLATLNLWAGRRESTPSRDAG